MPRAYPRPMYSRSVRWTKPTSPLIRRNRETPPPLRLSGFPNARRAQEQDASSLVLYSGAVELKHLPAHGCGYEMPVVQSLCNLINRLIYKSRFFPRPV